MVTVQASCKFGLHQQGIPTMKFKSSVLSTIHASMTSVRKNSRHFSALNALKLSGFFFYSELFSAYIHYVNEMKHNDL